MSSPPPGQSPAVPQSPGSVVAALALDFTGHTRTKSITSKSSGGRRSRSVPPPLSHPPATTSPGPSVGDVVTTTEDIPDESIGPKLLSAVVWKRRTGITGKLKLESNAWERRRIELRGSYLTYHTCRERQRHGSPTPSKRSSSAISESSYWLYNNAKGAAENVRYAANYAANGVAAAAAMVNPYSTASTSGSSDAEDAPNAPKVAEQIDPNARGCLDLVKGRASVAVSRSASSFPTPYTISVHAGYLAPRYSDIHWRFCFDSREEQVVWLSALADVIVGFGVPQSKDIVAVGSVDESEEEEKEEGKGSKEEVIQASSVSTALSRRQHCRQRIMGLILSLILMNALFYLSRYYPLSPAQWWRAVVLLNAGLLLFFGSTKTTETAANDHPASCVSSMSPIAEGATASDDPTRSSGGTPLSTSATARASSIPINLSHRPIAGATTMRVKDPSDEALNDDGHEFAKWRALPGTMFQVRSHGYTSSKKKVSSPSELYRLVSVDIFESQARIPDISGKVILPGVSSSDNSSVGKWNSPDTFVISFTLPTQSPSIYKPTTDGQGYTVTMYHEMKESTRKILKRLTSVDSEETGSDPGNEDKQMVNAVKLFEEWCTRSPTDKSFQARFKVIVIGQNLKEIGIPTWIAKYNGKPFLIKRDGVTGFLYEHRDQSAMEFDISFHHFPYLFKQGTSYLKGSFFQKVLATFGFVIEGRNDDELPEVVIGEGMQICYPNPAIAIQAEDLFSGKSPTAQSGDSRDGK
mmetsp:Transcript_2273/g.6623  ORF Transcript_2273/g.6623 Transcript_2273/m.6623 type:complete len:752 (-) Transcript_2273:1712-3967(-)